MVSVFGDLSIWVIFRSGKAFETEVAFELQGCVLIGSNRKPSKL